MEGAILAEWALNQEVEELETQVDNLQQMVISDARQPGRYRRQNMEDAGSLTPREDDAAMGVNPDEEAAAAVAAAIALAKI